MHPPRALGQPSPQGPPDILSPEAPGFNASLPVNILNAMYMQKNQGISDRLEVNLRGYDTVFSQ